MRAVALALLLGGCLIVRTSEATVEDVCPTVEPELMSYAVGPFAISVDVYFISANGTLARLPYDGGVPVELTRNRLDAAELAVDADAVYWAANDAIVRQPFDGSSPSGIAVNQRYVTRLLVDDDSVVWAGSEGLLRWTKADQQVALLSESDQILGLDAANGMYFYTDARNGVVRRTPQDLLLANSSFPGPLTVTSGGVYFYELLDPVDDYAGALRLVPIDGGPLVTTANDLTVVLQMDSDDNDIYLATALENEYRIKRVSRFGGAPRTLACGRFEDRPIRHARTPQHVWWADGNALYRIDPAAIPVE
jgi:hypothetical protein